MDTLQDSLAVTYQETRNLNPYPHNARTHSKRQIRQIADSIRAFGFTNPILIDSSGTIVAGHGRVAAAQLLGIARVPTICLENLTQDQVRAYVLADNKLADNAGWDDEILKIELQYLTSTNLGFDVSVTGFEIGEIDLILQDSKSEEHYEEQVEVSTEPPITKPGDVWLLGQHRLICGDSLNESTYLALMENKAADMAFTDPPYNVRIDGNVSGKGSIRHREFAMASGEMTQAEFTNFLSRALGFLKRSSKPGSVHFICMDWRHAFEILQVGTQIYATLLNLCVWAKDSRYGIRTPDYLSLVAPNYAMTDTPIHEWGVHVFVENQGYVRLPDQEVKRRIELSSGLPLPFLTVGEDNGL